MSSVENLSSNEPEVLVFHTYPICMCSIRHGASTAVAPAIHSLYNESIADCDWVTCPQVQAVTAQPAQLVTANLLLNTKQQPQHAQQAPTQTLSIAPSQQPTHVRYILPSVQVG